MGARQIWPASLIESGPEKGEAALMDLYGIQNPG